LGIVVIVLYVIAMIALGWWAMRKTKTVGDFFLGGRSIGPWMSAFAYGTTYFSAVLFIGYGGKLGWGFGLGTMWIVAGNVIVGSFLAWLVLGRKTREMTARLNALTMPAFLGERYRSQALKIAAAILIFLFLVPYSASVYMGLSYLFEKALGVSYIQAIGLLALLTGVYLVMGGYFAVTLTDFLMGLMMISGVGLMLTLLTRSAGGIVHATKLLTDWQVCSPALKPGPPGSIPGWMTLASLVVVTSLGAWGLPQMVQKFYSIKSGDQVKRAMIVATLFALVVTLGGYYTGALTHLNLPSYNAVQGEERPHAAVNIPDPIKEAQEQQSAELTLPQIGVRGVRPVSGTRDALPVYTDKSQLPLKMGKDGMPVMDPSGKPIVDWDRWIPKYLMEKLPPWVMIVIALLVFAASMSTLSSLVLVSSSAIAMDLYGGILRPKAEKGSVLILMRVLCALFVALSLMIALKPPSYIITLMVISWGVLAGSFAAPYFYGLYWRRATTIGAWAGMVVGVGAGVYLYKRLGVPGVPVAGAVSILLPFLIVPLVSLVTKPLDMKFLDGVFKETPKKET
jgi:Na+/proline symporter